MSSAGILIVGGTGRLGRALAAVLEAREVRYRAPGRGEIDLTLFDSLIAFVEGMAPSAVFNAGAYTDVARCELRGEREIAFRANRDGPTALARACAGLGIPLIHISTDYVFDGDRRTPYREDDRPNPIQTYGLTKLEGELAVLSAHPGALIARVSTVFGPWVPNRPAYPDAILRQAAEGDRIEVVEWPVSSPTLSLDAAEALVDLWTRGATGVVHVVNDGGCSRLDLARAVVYEAGLADRVTVVGRAEPTGGMRRPRYSVLDTSRLASLIGRRLRPWREALRAYIAMVGSGAVS